MNARLNRGRSGTVGRRRGAWQAVAVVVVVGGRGSCRRQVWWYIWLCAL